MNKETIREVLVKIDKLKNQLELYLERKQINYYKTQPSSSTFRDVISGKSDGFTTFDKFTHYTVQDEKYDETIYEIQETINAYERYIINEMKRISKIDPMKVKIYALREDAEFIKNNGRKRTWAEIANIVNYSDRQVMRIYNDVVNN